MLPHSLDILSEYLGGFRPPEGQFDAGGEWDHRYLMWIALRGATGLPIPQPPDGEPVARV
jgi:hypothetical protein